jgi:acyl-CoA synthetase (AMP-forming)/AMP-acid ligase II
VTGAGEPGVDRLHQHSLGDVLRAHRTNRPAAPAAVCGGLRLSYLELDRRVNQLANALLGAGVRGRDRLVWLGQNCHRLLEGLLAAAKIGAVFCPANWRQSATELGFVLGDAGPAVVIWQQAEVGEVAARARADTASEALWLCHDGTGRDSYETFLAKGSPGDPEPAVDEADAVLMMYTAAFGGTPNGALLSHRALVTQGSFVAQIMGIDADYRYLNCGPLFHVATFMTTLATLVSGGANVFTPRVDAEELCRLIEAERCTGAFLMGPTIDQILEVNAQGRYDLKSLRTFAGTPQWQAMITVDDSPWGRRPAGYGQTEVMGMATFNALGPSLGSHGRPPPYLRIGIMDPEGNLLGPGETGEIVARGPTVMNGYHNRPELNAQRRAGGWHHTNDLGRLEEDGSLSFIGPRTRLIKSAAENIYPIEVENCLRSHPAVAEAAVIGVPDPTWTQNVKAVVVLRPGQRVTEEELVEHCRARIASYKKPKSVEFVDELPKKGWEIDYQALDERFGGGGYPGGAGRHAV